MVAFGEIHITTGEDATADRQIRRRAEAGELRQIAERVYTSNLHEDLAAVLRRNVWYILPHLFPNTVLTSRSGAKVSVYQPDKDGKSYVFLTGPYSTRNVDLPGLEVRLIRGPSALPGDTAMTTSNFYVPSRARTLLENLKPSRTRGGIQRNLRAEEFEDYLVTLLDSGGVDNFNLLRDEARLLVPHLDAEKEFTALDRIMGALLGTQKTRFASQAAKVRASGADKACVERLQALFSHLKSLTFPNILASSDGATRQSTAFIEAYFSNFIEGTEFTPKEAQRIVYTGQAPVNRPADGHDILATYRLLTDEKALRARPSSYEEFENMLRARHSLLMHARPEKHPGKFKSTMNSVGGVQMVAPGLVIGTFKIGWDLLQTLTEPFSRGLFLHCLIAEVHPFDDGNGRMSRLHFTSELLQADQAHVIIPTVFRDDYIGGMRSLTRRGDPAPITRACLRAQETTAATEMPTVDQAIEAWAKTNAFMKPNANARMEIYDPATKIDWRGEMPAPISYWEAEENPTSILPDSLSR